MADGDLYRVISSYWKPSPSSRQISYFLTGALAGASTIPIELLWQRRFYPKTTPLPNIIRKATPPIIYRAGVRFWVFDIVRSQIRDPSVPTWIKGGISGAAGGFAEMCAQSVLDRRVPTLSSLASQPTKLFFCFGTYTYLSTSLSEELPPRPFWYCWLMGAAAGGVGSGIVASFDRSSWRNVWRKAVPRGMLTIGTVIAVQVTSCAEVLNRMKI